MIRVSDLIHDPVFQLNALLWLTWPLPPTFGIKPLLWNAGFEVYSISKKLAPPPEVLARLKDSTLQYQDHICPDLVIQRKSDKVFLLVECKKSSFGSQSTTAFQARTLLVLSGPCLSISLGLPVTESTNGAACYFLPEAQASRLKDTLDELTKELGDNKLKIGDVILLSLSLEEESLNLYVNLRNSNIQGLPQDSTPFMQIKEETDPRPLYFIPFDPDCDQSKEERDFCLRILHERIHLEILGAAGRAAPPIKMTLRMEQLLNSATAGMFGRWDNSGAKIHYYKCVRKLVVEMIAKISELLSKSPSKMKCSEYLSLGINKEVLLNIPDRDSQRIFCNALARFSCESMEITPEAEPDLFENEYS